MHHLIYHVGKCTVFGRDSNCTFRGKNIALAALLSHTTLLKYSGGINCNKYTECFASACTKPYFGTKETLDHGQLPGLVGDKCSPPKFGLEHFHTIKEDTLLHVPDCVD